MSRSRAFLALVTVAVLGVPNETALAACASALPVADRRLAHIECEGVHPGAGLLIPSQKWGTEYKCTAGLAFTDQARNRYVTIPGSCFLDYDCLEDAILDELPPPLNELVPPLPICVMPTESELEPHYKRSGPAVKDAGGRRVGALVYAVNKDGYDFALVKLDAGVRLDPKVPMYGGPVGFSAFPVSPTEGYAVSASRYNYVPNARTGVLHSWGRTGYHLTEAFLTAAPGSPVVLSDGTSVGYYRGHTTPIGWEVMAYGPALDRVASRTGLRLRLVTAPMS